MNASAGDMEGYNAAYKKALDFSSKYPTYEITDSQINDSINKRIDDQLLANEIGARVKIKDLPIVLPMLNKD
jgi:hypothetical protein